MNTKPKYPFFTGIELRRNLTHLSNLEKQLGAKKTCKPIPRAFVIQLILPGST